MSVENQNDLDEVMTENEVEDFLGCKKSVLAKYRKDGLPYCRLSTTHRLYLVSDVIDFIKGKRMVSRDV